MKYLAWRNAIENELVNAGLNSDYAKERARSVRGMYYTESTYMSPLKVAHKLIRTCMTGLTNEKIYKQYCKMHKLKNGCA